MSTRLAVRNLLKDALVTMTPAAEPDLEEQYLSDGPGQLGGMFGDLTADPEVLISLGLDIPYGDGDGPGVFSGAELARASAIPPDIHTPWTVVPIVPDDASYLGIYDDATLGFGLADHGGNGWTLVLSGTSGGVTAKLPLVAAAGATYRVQGWAVNGSGSSNAASIRLRDALRNLYLKTDGSWDASPQDLVLDATAAHVWLGIGAGSGVEFTLPTAAELGGIEDVDLELQLVNADAGFAFYDDLSIQQTIEADLCGVFGGHNVPSGAVVKWATSEDGSSWTDRATFTITPHQFFALLDSPVTAPFHRLQVGGAPLAKYFFGDLVLGLTQVIPNGPEPDLSILYEEKGQPRLAGPAGVEYVSNRGPYPIRTVSFSMAFRNAAEVEEARAILVDQLRGGAEPCVLMPEDTQLPDLAIYGRIQQPLEFRLSPIRGDLPEGEGQERLARVSLTFVEGMGFEDNG